MFEFWYKFLNNSDMFIGVLVVTVIILFFGTIILIVYKHDSDEEFKKELKKHQIMLDHLEKEFEKMKKGL